jgi:hypothetical protein
MKYVLVVVCIFTATLAFPQRYITINKTNPSYLSFSDGQTYVPIGINMINPSGRNSNNVDSAFSEIEQWMKSLSMNGGNYVRIWLSQSFWDVEEDSAGRYDEEKAKRIDRFIEMARKYHLYIKLTLEHFRSITIEENPQKWATKFSYHTSKGGPLDSVVQYLSTDKGKQLFLNKLDFYQKRYGNDTLFFGWELWNEMNALSVPQDSVFYAWNTMMLDAVKRKFPKHLVMQSLGSFDGDYAVPVYSKVMAMKGNEVAQVHRYLDLGAKYQVCHAPMDVICASAIKDLKNFHINKPVLLAETGAVEPNHAGPSKYYPKDTAGILLHDMLFAPFFTGSAGTGMPWHWESYVHKNNLWHHYARFHESVKDIDPVAEGFVPSFMETDSLRIYMLKGKHNTLIWLRDKNSDWQTELEQGIPPRVLQNARLNLALLRLQSYRSIQLYDPWKNKWTTIAPSNTILLPPFSRSMVIKLIR